MEDRSELVRGSREIVGFLWSTLLAPALYAVARLEVAEALEKGPLPVAELARSVGAHPESLHRVIRALATVGVFEEAPDGRIGHTAKSRLLLKAHPRSIRAIALFFGEPFRWETAGQLFHSVKTGEPAFEARHGQTLFDYLTDHPDAAEVFDSAMTAFSATSNDDVLAAYDFSRHDVLCDVGGGHGSLLFAILEKYPSVRGVVYDLPHVVRQTAEASAKRGLVARMEVAAGSFFERVPGGADAYLLKSIIHDWDDERAALVLSRCREALRPGGRVLVVERVIPPGNEPFDAKLVDLEMMALTPGGKERTREQYEALFSRAGLRIVAIHASPSSRSIIEAEPIGT